MNQDILCVESFSARDLYLNHKRHKANYSDGTVLFIGDLGWLNFIV